MAALSLVTRLARKVSPSNVKTGSRSLDEKNFFTNEVMVAVSRTFESSFFASDKDRFFTRRVSERTFIFILFPTWR